MRTSFVVSFALALGVGLLAPASAAGVITVAGSGPADFTQIADAVAAARDGDLILVSPSAGSYAAFTIDGKALVISSAQAGTPVSTRQITIENLAAGQTCVLRGLDATAPNNAFAPGLRV
jgi:hypothetical protein